MTTGDVERWQVAAIANNRAQQKVMIYASCGAAKV